MNKYSSKISEEDTISDRMLYVIAKKSEIRQCETTQRYEGNKARSESPIKGKIRYGNSKKLFIEKCCKYCIGTSCEGVQNKLYKYAILAKFKCELNRDEDIDE